MKKKNQKLTVYTKFCLDCVMPEFWKMFRQRAFDEGYTIKVIRTSYRPFAHKKAVASCGDEHYFSFAVFPDGKVLKLEGAINMWDNARNKLVKSGKKKGGRKNVQRLPKAARTIRVDGVEDKGVDIEVKNEGVD